MSPDEKHLVQVRAGGSSFNRLAPYTSLDDYLPEIERTWRLYLTLASPLQIRLVRLRYINRIWLPLQQDRVELKGYLRIAPLPEDSGLAFSSFLTQHMAEEVETGHQIRVVLATEAVRDGKLPLIFDNGVEATGRQDPESWAWIHEQIQALRGLKDRVFRGMLTDECLDLFR